MGRPSKLTPAQWTEVERRLLEGETARALGREFEISEAAIRLKLGANLRISAQSAQVQETAQKIADAEVALQELPVAQRPVAMGLAAILTRTSFSVAEAAELGADTGKRMHQAANKTARTLDMANPENLKLVAAAARTGNEALQPAIQLLGARERLRDEPPPDPDAAPTSGVLVVPGLAASSEAWATQGKG